MAKKKAAKTGKSRTGKPPVVMTLGRTGGPPGTHWTVTIVLVGDGVYKADCSRLHRTDQSAGNWLWNTLLAGLENMITLWVNELGYHKLSEQVIESYLTWMQKQVDQYKPQIVVECGGGCVRAVHSTHLLEACVLDHDDAEALGVNVDEDECPDDADEEVKDLFERAEKREECPHTVY